MMKWKFLNLKDIMRRGGLDELKRINKQEYGNSG